MTQVQSEYPTVDECLATENKCNRQKCLIQKVLESLTYENAAQAISGEKRVPAWSDNVVGKFTPLGVFEDYESCLEYFHGSLGNTFLGFTFVSMDVKKAICDCNTVAWKGILLVKNLNVLDGTVNPNILNECRKNGQNVTLQGFWNFNANGTEIISFDLSVDNADAWVTRLRSPECNPTGTTPLNTTEAIEQICQVEEIFCRNTQIDPQFSNFTHCVHELSQLEVGNADHTMWNTLACRGLHASMLPYRPEIHCNHIGMQSKKCIITEYSQLYDFVIHEEECVENETSNAVQCRNYVLLSHLFLGFYVLYLQF